MVSPLMGLNPRLLDCACLLGLFVLSLLTIGGEALAPSTCSSLRSSSSPSNTCSTANHNGYSHSLPRINQKASCHMNIPPHRKKCGSVLCRCATPTTDGEEVVHAISRAFLAESEASGRWMTKHDQKWWARFGELEEYKHEYGDCNVPQSYKDNPQLGTWINKQRQSYKKNNLSSERVEALESIGFEWTRPTGKAPDDANWWKRLGELEEYKHEYGDCNVPQYYKANPQLGTWINRQRQRYKKNVLSSERVEALESIGFEWTRPTGGKAPDDANWWKRLGELEEYKEMHGDCNVPHSYQANPQLGNWVMNQRAFYHRFFDENWTQSPMITEERIDALNKIGFEWRLRERPEWDERYDELVIYREEHGDTLVPTDQRRGSDNKYRVLAMWVNTQRREYRLLQKGKHSQLTDERIQKLNRIGFVWDAQEAAWEEKYAELVSYKEIHGDTLVSRGSLVRWVQTQRNQYRLQKEGSYSPLSNERIEKLNQIGFVWDAQEAAWEEKFAELIEFKAIHSHTDVPKSWENQHLYLWVSKQRREYRKFKEGKQAFIKEDRIERLDGIGFLWRSKNTYQWKIRLGELRDFYNENGAAPVSRAKHPTLYNWVSTQKKEYDKFVRGEQTNMDEERIKDLESIGFFEVYGK